MCMVKRARVGLILCVGLPFSQPQQRWPGIELVRMVRGSVYVCLVGFLSPKDEGCWPDTGSVLGHLVSSLTKDTMF